MPKKILIGIIVLLFSLTNITTYASYTGDEIKVIVNNQEITFDVPPQIVNGRTLVPMRDIFEALGASVEYDSDTETITGTKENIKVVLKLNSTEAKVNDKLVILEVPATLVDGRTLVPVRFIAESLDMDVSWVSNTRKVLIMEKDKTQKTYTEIKTRNISSNNIKPSENDFINTSLFGSTFEAQTGKVTIELLQLNLKSGAGFRLLDETGDNTALYIKTDVSYYESTKSYSIHFSVLDEYGIDTGNIFNEETFNPFDTEIRTINMTVVADTNTQKADIYVDGKLRLEKQNFVQPVKNIGICSFWGATLKSVSKTLKTGELEELKTRDNVPIVTAKARDLNNLLTGLKREIEVFDPQKGAITVDADFDYSNPKYYQFELLDETGQKTAILIQTPTAHMHASNLLASYHKGENGGSCFEFLPSSIIDNNQIVHLRIVADIAAQKADVFVNGELSLEKVDFYEPVENIGRCEIHGNISLTGVKK